MSEPLSLTLALIGYGAVTAAARAQSAVSREAEAVRDSASQATASAEQSIALFGAKADAIASIWTLAAEHSHEGWDGDDARPVSLLAANFAEAFVRAIPGNLPLPEFAAEPDGSISLDWIVAPTRLLTLSVGCGDRLPYAWLDGTDKGHGVARFSGDSLPPRIISAIRETLGAPDAGLRVA